MPRVAWTAGALALLLGCGREPVVVDPRLVLLVTVDTLRADRVGAFGSDLGLTPNLDALAAESVAFQRAYAPAAFTVPSISCLLTGWYPEQNVVQSNEHALPSSVPTIATELAARGYRAGAVVSNWVLRSEAGLARGFEAYDDTMTEKEVSRHAPERSAPATTAAALAMLDRLREPAGKPVFLWVHYQDPHGPYTPPEADREASMAVERARPDGGRHLPFGADHRGLDGIPDYQRIGDEDEVAFYRAGYDGEVRHCDREIGKLFEGVRQRGLWKDAVVLFAADHGEALGEHGAWFAHGEYLDDAQIRVPLLLRAPGLEPASRDDAAGLVDVVPTLLPLLGMEASRELPGRNLLAPGAESQESELYLATLLASTRPRLGLIRDGFRYVVTSLGGGNVAEELDSLDDPGNDRKPAEPERAARMRLRLAEVRDGVRARAEERRQQLTPADLEAMRKLGYTGGR